MCYVEAAKSVTEDITATKGDSIYAGDTEYGTSDLLRPALRPPWLVP